MLTPHGPIFSPPPLPHCSLIILSKSKIYTNPKADPKFGLMESYTQMKNSKIFINRLLKTIGNIHFTAVLKSQTLHQNVYNSYSTSKQKEGREHKKESTVPSTMVLLDDITHNYIWYMPLRWEGKSEWGRWRERLVY